MQNCKEHIWKICVFEYSTPFHMWFLATGSKIVWNTLCICWYCYIHDMYIIPLLFTTILDYLRSENSMCLIGKHIKPFSYIQTSNGMLSFTVNWNVNYFSFARINIFTSRLQFPPCVNICMHMHMCVHYYHIRIFPPSHENVIQIIFTLWQY
jgi:hypothetical protein